MSPRSKTETRALKWHLTTDYLHKLSHWQVAWNTVQKSEKVEDFSFFDSGPPTECKFSTKRCRDAANSSPGSHEVMKSPTDEIPFIE